MKARLLAASGIAALTAAAGLGLAGTAHAATTVSAVTHLTQHADSGYSGDNWALDNLTRTVTVVTPGSPVAKSLCGPSATACFAFTGTIHDTGTAFATTGAVSPGAQAVPVTGSPTAAVTGDAAFLLDSSSNAPSASLVPASLAGAGNAEQSTTNWAEQLFPAGTTFGPVNASPPGPSLTAWSWTYKDAKDCQAWTDAVNGTQATSGDITGVSACPPPPPPPAVITLSHGKGTATSSSRATVTWQQSAPSWDKLVITGPGAINGHVGWVHVTGTTGSGAYTGLSGGHNYSVAVTPYTAENGTVEGKTGTISFLTPGAAATARIPVNGSLHAGEFCTPQGAEVTGSGGVLLKCEPDNGLRWVRA